MKLPMEWLNDFTDIKGIAPIDYAHSMTMTGSKVEAIENAGKEIDKVVVGRILSVEKHPNADTLSVCNVHAGNGEIVIITAAKNVAAGDLVPVALDGSTLFGGHKINKTKLRGLESNGMFCSHEELGMDIDDYHGACENGILILKEDYAPGADIKEVLGLDKDIVEFEITSNRPDCLSVIGLARETAVTFDRPFNVPVPMVKKEQGNINDMALVAVEAPDLCPRYCARVVKNIKVAESPDWLKARLKACGIRAINNIVDITNYVLLEYGQPMHAFDLSLLDGGKIVVRRTRKGETITTLDGQERELDESMLVIADSKKPVAVAGVMGGANSEINENTKTLLFESANFNGAAVRLAAKKLGMRTEASSRFEKGLDVNGVLAALERACQLIEELGCGEVVGGIIDVNAKGNEVNKIPFNPAKINAFLGCEIDEKQMKSILAPLGFIFEGEHCTAPSYRQDVEGMADVAEEVARIYGYDKIPSTLLRGETLVGKKTAVQNAEDTVKEVLTGIGFYEVVTYSFVSPKIFDMLMLPKDSGLRNTVNVTNPLGEDTSVMRTTMMHSVLEVLSRNYNLRCPAAKVFEVGRIYLPTGDELPEERTQIALGMYGGVDFYDLKGAVEEILAALKAKNIEFKANGNNSSLHPGRTADIYIDGKLCGVIGEAHPEVLKNYELPVKAYIAQLDFETILSCASADIQYKPLPKFPAVERDLALIVDDGVPVAELEKVIRKAAGALLEELKLFDVYKGKQVGEGKKSVAYSLTLRAADRTLTDEEIAACINKVVKSLAKDAGAELR